MSTFLPDEEDEEYYEYFGDHEFGASDGEDDGFPFDEIEKGVNLEDFRVRAWTRLYQHYVCSVGGGGNPTEALLTEAELHMTHQDYVQALICALSTETLESADESPATLRRQMICTIALYQLGDKLKAEELRDAISTLEEENISEYLNERFKGTCEVLDMMPELINLLQSTRSK